MFYSILLIPYHLNEASTGDFCGRSHLCVSSVSLPLSVALNGNQNLLSKSAVWLFLIGNTEREQKHVNNYRSSSPKCLVRINLTSPEFNSHWTQNNQVLWESKINPYIGRSVQNYSTRTNHIFSLANQVRAKLEVWKLQPFSSNIASKLMTNKIYFCSGLV